MNVDPRTVLLVEEDSPHRIAIVASLQREGGYRVLEASDGVAGFDRLQREAAPPALIILEWMMPAWHGLEFLSSLATDPRYDDTPVVVMAEIATTSRIPSARIAAVLTRPFRTRTLLDVVGRLAGASEAPPPRTGWRAGRPPHGRPTALLRKPLAKTLLDGAHTGRHRR